MTDKNKNDLIRQRGGTDTNLVSIVIPTRDSGRTLRKCLDSIMNQTYQIFEILIIDKRSTDHTVNIASEYRARIFSLDAERTTAKNFALNNANGKFILFLDSDMALEPTVIEQCVNAGFISERDKFLIMKRSKVFIFPSYEEGWGIAVAEAIACGLNVVLYDIGTYDPFRKQVIMVEKANTSKMAEIIINLIERESYNNIEDKKLVRIELVLDWKEVAN